MKRLENHKLDVPAFLETRVLSEYRSNQKHSHQLFVWKSIALTLSLLIIAFVGFYQIQYHSTFQAIAFQPIELQIDLKEARSSKIAYALVELPDGVQFYSKKFPEVGNKKSLKFNLAKKIDKFDYYSIVVHSNSVGLKKIKVHFFDSESKLISVRDMDVQFMTNGESA